jgi:hypothetical protein
MAKVTIKYFKKQEMKEAMLNKIGRAIQIKAMSLVPFDKGLLSAHIKYKVEGNIVVIYTEGIPYADKMEYGCGPMQLTELEKEDIREWARAGRSGRPRFNKGGQEGVIKKLEKEGIEAGTPEHPFETKGGRFRPFLRTSAHQLKDQYKYHIVEAIK